MEDVLTLLKPRVWPLMQRGSRRNKRGHGAKFFIFATLGLVFWLGIFAVSFHVLSYFNAVEDIGDILSYKLLSMMLIVSFALLIFSSILTSLSKLYLSRDLQLVHSMPIPGYKVFISRWIESVIDSSWMVMIFTMPVFLAFGIVFEAGLFYYPFAIGSMIVLAVIASAASTLLVMTAVIVIPASRMRSIFILMGILFFVVIYLAIRLLRPELLVDPEVFETTLIYISSIQTPASPVLPTTWVYDGIRAALAGSISGGLFHGALALSFAGCILILMVVIADALYFEGFSKTQTSTPRLFKNNIPGDRLLGFLPGPTRSFAVKEIKTFLRDQTQWTQLFLIAALVIIYVYNFKVLPLERSPIKTIYLQNLFSFLNMGLALFVLTAIAGRFAYPAVSLEKDAFWLVTSSPLSLRSFLWIKFCVYYLPLLLLTEILIISTNILLQVTTFMMVLSTATVFFLVPGIVALGIGLGAAYPDFKAENPAQSVTSFGGLIFMILCAGTISLIILLEAGPVYHLFMANLHAKTLSPLFWLWLVFSLAVALFICILAVLLPMRFGEKRLTELSA
jgi:ABC-2 type transport system permease protein